MIDFKKLTYGTTLPAGRTYSTIIGDFDFETYSPAGFVFNIDTQKFELLKGASKYGLPTVGMHVYTEHPEADVLCMAYDLKDGNGRRLWKPGDDLPQDLFYFLNEGKLLEAWNVGFEICVWQNICVSKYGFPNLPLNQLRCASAKSRAFALPKSLADAGLVVNITNQKDKRGEQVLKIFSVPRNYTEKRKYHRTYPQDDADNAKILYEYNLRDIEAEAELSSIIPDLNDFELKFWQIDQEINRNGVSVDMEAVDAAIYLVEEIYIKYNREINDLTEGKVTSGSQLPALKKWLEYRLHKSINCLDAEAVEIFLQSDIPQDVRKVLELRRLLNSASVKKLYALKNRISKDNRLRDLFIYHSARTGRAAGAGVQPQNLPNSGPSVEKCKCSVYYSSELILCPNCGLQSFVAKTKEWNSEAMGQVINILKHRNLTFLEDFYPNPIQAISSCLRGMFIAKEGHDLICSDYSAIEAVVLAELAGEEWRREVFRTHGKIYEMSASKITGVPFEKFMEHRQKTGNHHPLRKKVGKVAELASGYGGWIGAWRQFGADDFFEDETALVTAIKKWRNANPKICEFWGGLRYGTTDDYYGIEGMAILATLNSGCEFSYRDIKYCRIDDILYCELPSGRFLAYHKPQLTMDPIRNKWQLSYEGWNTNPKNGKTGWVRMNTYGGKLTENIVQAVSRDILANAIINLHTKNYPVVLHVHDEIVCEVSENFGTVDEMQTIMSIMPSWAHDWPVKASGGWRAKRYSK